MVGEAVAVLPSQHKQRRGARSGRGQTPRLFLSNGRGAASVGAEGQLSSVGCPENKAGSRALRSLEMEMKGAERETQHCSAVSERGKKKKQTQQSFAIGDGDSLQRVPCTPVQLGGAIFSQGQAEQMMAMGREGLQEERMRRALLVWLSWKKSEEPPSSAARRNEAVSLCPQVVLARCREPACCRQPTRCPPGAAALLLHDVSDGV